MPEEREQNMLDAMPEESDATESTAPDAMASEEKPTIAKGDRVRINSSGKRGTIVGFLSGFVLVQTDGSTRDFGYLPREITPENGGAKETR